jgi:hypothetical protein
MPWIKVPAATITFSGIAEIVPAAELPDEARVALTKGLKFDSADEEDVIDAVQAITSLLLGSKVATGYCNWP